MVESPMPLPFNFLAWYMIAAYFVAYLAAGVVLTKITFPRKFTGESGDGLPRFMSIILWPLVISITFMIRVATPKA